jgi:hypothetical protein
MLFEKVIDATVNVRNPINFCADKERHVMAELRNTFVGRCFKGAFIVQIVSVLQESLCRLTSTNASGEGYIDVQFVAQVAVFSRWDILVGVEIVSHQQMLVGTYDARPPLAARGAGGEEPAQAAVGTKNARAVVSLLASKAVEALAVGQKISVRVVMAQHQPLQPQAAVVGTLLVCDQAAPVYRLRGALDGAAKAELGPVLAAIELELEARAALVESRKADLWFFELLLYAYRGTTTPPDQQVPGPGGTAWGGPGGLRPLEEGAIPQNVLQLVRRAVDGEAVPVAGYWSRSLALYRSSPLAAQAAALPPGWSEAATGEPRAVFAEFLKNILDFLVAIRQMAELYNTRELVDSHRGLWTAMRSIQKPVATGGMPLDERARALVSLGVAVNPDTGKPV